MTTTVILCPRCKSPLGNSVGDRIAVSPTVAVCHRVTLTCLKCGCKRTWKPGPSGADKRGAT